MTSKAALRRSLRAQRATLDPHDYATSQQIITNRLINAVDWNMVHSVCSYRALHDTRELDAEPALIAIKESVSSITVAYVEQGRNADQPEGTFEVILVPLVGYSKDRYRLGMGGGWYDRFLAQHPEALTIGVGYQWAEVEFQPEPHDLPLDIIISG